MKIMYYFNLTSQILIIKLVVGKTLVVFMPQTNMYLILSIQFLISERYFNCNYFIFQRICVCTYVEWIYTSL